MKKPSGPKRLVKYRSRIRIRRPTWIEFEVRRVINITWKRG